MSIPGCYHWCDYRFQSHSYRRFWQIDCQQHLCCQCPDCIHCNFHLLLRFNLGSWCMGKKILLNGELSCCANVNKEQIVIGEVFPLPIRSRGVALSTASNWLWNTVRAPFSSSRMLR